MNRAFTFAAFAAAALAVGGGVQGSVCAGVLRATPLGPAGFQAILDTVAAAWNSNRSELAASCFTEAAVYLEPPDRQLYRRRAALEEFFWLSLAFTVTVIANFVALGVGQGRPAAWVTYSPLLPLALLLLTGLYMFVLPYATRWRSGRRTDVRGTVLE